MLVLNYFVIYLRYSFYLNGLAYNLSLKLLSNESPTKKQQ